MIALFKIVVTLALIGLALCTAWAAWRDRALMGRTYTTLTIIAVLFAALAAGAITYRTMQFGTLS